jgi:hypothetical protein
MRAGCAPDGTLVVATMTGLPVGVTVVTGDANVGTLTVRVGAGLMLPVGASVPTKVGRALSVLDTLGEVGLSVIVGSIPSPVGKAVADKDGVVTVVSDGLVFGVGSCGC